MTANPARVAASPAAKMKRWMCEASKAESLGTAATLCTVGPGGVPSSRTVTVKALYGDSCVFTTALWNRKAHDIAQNPAVSLLFFWPRLRRQMHVAGLARRAERQMVESLFAERPRAHQLQTLVSRQGEPIESLLPIRMTLAQLRDLPGPVACPEDWGAFRVVPRAVEFWTEAPDRIHTRELWIRERERWTTTLLAP